MIASDVDGTMLPRGGTISPGLRRAIELCRRRGIPFVIASGRWRGALENVIRQAGCEDMPIIIANGAAILGAEGKPLRERFIDDAAAQRTYDILRRFNVQINAYLRGALYTLNTAALIRQSTMVKDYIGGEGYRLVVDDRAAFEAEALRGVYKLEAMTENCALIAELHDALRDTGLTVTHSSPRNVEIMAPGTGKGEALRWLAKRLGLSVGQCMAFGDSANDIDLLSTAGWPVAMGNADEDVRRISRIVAPADSEDGVARTLFEYVLKTEYKTEPLTP